MKSMKTALFLSFLAVTLLSSSGQGFSVATRAQFRAVREKINLLGEILEQIEQVADMAVRRELQDTLTVGRHTSHRIRQQPAKLIIYKDVLTGKDMFTNRNKITVRDDRFYEVECKHAEISTKEQTRPGGGIQSCRAGLGSTRFAGQLQKLEVLHSKVRRRRGTPISTQLPVPTSRNTKAFSRVTCGAQAAVCWHGVSYVSQRRTQDRGPC
ncbi:uncharacterized protein LOC144883716 isoform X3 [Branchiostoma floridae x Branchiostoma japonicum]